MDANFFVLLLDADFFCDFPWDFRPDLGVTTIFPVSVLAESFLLGVFVPVDFFPLCDLVLDVECFGLEFGVVGLVFSLGVLSFRLEVAELSDLEEVILNAFSSLDSSTCLPLCDDNFLVLDGAFSGDFLFDLEVDFGVAAPLFLELSAFSPLLLGVFLSISSESNSRALEAGLDFFAAILRVDFLAELDFERGSFDLGFGDDFTDFLFGVSFEASSFVFRFLA